MIDLYTSSTPNGWKVSIALEEMELPYKFHHINLQAGDQKTPEFTWVSPNGRIPAIIDCDLDDFPIFESGAILMYLAEKTGKFLPTDVRARSRVVQWLMFQMGGVGPMMGQANVFHRYFPEKIQPAIDRYQHECRRLFEVMDRQLKDNEFLADDYSIADMANFAWARGHRWSGVDIEGLDNFKRWLDTIAARPAVDRGVKIPVDMEALRKGDGKGAKEFSKGAQKILQL